MGFGDFLNSLSGLYSSAVTPTRDQQNAATKGDQDRATVNSH
jgi:hypothetical protein